MNDVRSRLWLRPLRIPEDIPQVHDWVHREYARYWGMTGFDLASVEAAYREITGPVRAEAWLGLHDDEPAFLVETYRPEDQRVSHVYAVEPGDRGMHVLVAPPTRRIPDFTWVVFRVVMDHLFADPEARRVVVEPDVENTKIHALNARAGFVAQGVVTLPATEAEPEKRALLSFCTREAHRAATATSASAPRTLEERP